MPTPALHGIAAGRFRCKVNLNTIREVKQPRSAEEIVKWSTATPGSPEAPGCSPRRRFATDSLSTSARCAAPALAASNTGLDIAATCTIAELYGFQPPAGWTAAPLFQLCARAFLASFKI